MRNNRLSVGVSARLVVLSAAVFMAGTRAGAQQEAALHSFDDNTEGSFPVAEVVLDAAGNLYGTTQNGGYGTCNTSVGCGTAFELSPQPGGNWAATILYNFGSSGTDGYRPTASLTLDAKGNLYGTTPQGGSHGGGTVFELSSKGGGAWQERVLHNFGAGKDGSQPIGGLTIDSAGNLYGTTETGGAHGLGTVFVLVRQSGAIWKEQVLHSFTNTGSNSKDGRYPMDSLVFDKVGNLYGTTWEGGANGDGTVFEVGPRTGGGWGEKVLYSFGGPDGAAPTGNLVIDATGNLYGTTEQGGMGSPCGPAGCGVVFELTLTTGQWTESVLHNFSGNHIDGYNPYGGLTRDAAGNLYGTTYTGGTTYNGTVFELTPAVGGGWTETILHSFENSPDGSGPYFGSLALDVAGNLYGTTNSGGAHGSGTVFELTP